MLRAAIFDMDGLLVDSEPVWQDAEIEVFAQVGVALSRSDCWKTKGLRVDETVAYWFARRPIAAASPAEIEALLIENMTGRLRREAAPKPGARHAVDFFRAKGLRLALASSSALRLIEAALARLGMAGDFEVIRSAVDEPFGKPHPAVYRTAAARLGIAAADCVALEDSRPGIAAARAAGMLCVAVPDAGSGPPDQAARFARDSGGADLVLDSLERIDESVWMRLAALRVERAPANPDSPGPGRA